MPGSGSDDALAQVLDAAARTAEESAEAQRRAAGLARDVAASRRSSVEDPEAENRRLRQIVDLLAESARGLTQAVSRIRRIWARTLSAEGLSIRAIGELFGVSHQRVSALLSRKAAPHDGGDA